MKTLLALLVLTASSAASALVCQTPWDRNAFISFDESHARVQFDHWTYPDSPPLPYNSTTRSSVYYRGRGTTMLIFERSVLTEGVGRVHYYYPSRNSGKRNTAHVTLYCR